MDQTRNQHKARRKKQHTSKQLIQSSVKKFGEKQNKNKTTLLQFKMSNKRLFQINAPKPAFKHLQERKKEERKRKKEKKTLNTFLPANGSAFTLLPTIKPIYFTTA